MAFAAFAAPAQAANPWIQKRAPLNIAHQGGEDEFPSNTMYAFRKALRAGADMLELDIGVTKDDKVIVMHDTTVDGKTNGSGTVASKTLRQLKRLDAAYWFAPGRDDHYGHDHPRKAYRFRGIATGKRPAPKGFRARDFRVPTLARVLRAFPDVPINIEIKGRTPDEETAEYVRNAEVLAGLLEDTKRRDLIVVSFRQEAVDRFHELVPKIDLAPGIAGASNWILGGGSPGPGVAAFQVPITFKFGEHAAADHHPRERRPRPQRGLRLAELVLRRGPRRPGHLAPPRRDVRGRDHDRAAARPRAGARADRAPRELRLGRSETCSAGHHQVVRPPTVARSSGVPQRGQCPPRPRWGIRSPVCTPPRLIALRVAARSARRRASSSSSEQRAGLTQGREARPPERLIGQKVAHAGDRRLIHDAGLERRPPAAHALAKLPAGDLRGVGAEAREVGVEHHATQPAPVAQGQRPAVLEAQREAIPTALGPALVDHDAPGHSEMQPERWPARGVDPDGLALAMGLDQLGAGQGSGDLTRSMRATNPGVGVVDLGDAAAEPLLFDQQAGALDLG